MLVTIAKLPDNRNVLQVGSLWPPKGSYNRGIHRVCKNTFGHPEGFAKYSGESLKLSQGFELVPEDADQIQFSCAPCEWQLIRR